MKFIIDIPEKDVQGCYNCPFNYDFIACVAPNGPDYVDIDDYLGNSFITTRPEGCPLVPVVPDHEEMDRNNSERMSDELLPCPFCGGIPMVDCGYHYDYDGGNRYYAYSADVECYCGCTLHVEHEGPKEYVTNEHMLDFAIAAWNRRDESCPRS